MFHPRRYNHSQFCRIQPAKNANIFLQQACSVDEMPSVLLYGLKNTHQKPSKHLNPTNLSRWINLVNFVFFCIHWLMWIMWFDTHAAEKHSSGFSVSRQSPHVGFASGNPQDGWMADQSGKNPMVSVSPMVYGASNFWTYIHVGLIYYYQQKLPEFPNSCCSTCFRTLLPWVLHR